MWHATVFAAVTLVLCFVGPTGGIAAVPSEMNFQGILTDSNGDPASTGTYFIRFRIYDASDGSSVLWESDDGGEAYVPVEVTDGLYNYLLGSHGPLPESLADYDSLWLGVKVGPGEPEMTPLTKLVSVVFAMKSGFADSSAIALAVAPNSVQSQSIADAAILFSHIGQNGAVVGQIPKWNGTTWVASPDSSAYDVTSWQPLPFAPGHEDWSTSHPEDRQTVQYRRVNDVVFLRGLSWRIDGAFPPAGELIGALPAGFQPPMDILFYPYPFQVEIFTNGDIFVTYIISNGQRAVNFESMNFSTIP